MPNARIPAPLSTVGLAALIAGESVRAVPHPIGKTRPHFSTTSCANGVSRVVLSAVVSEDWCEGQTWMAAITLRLGKQFSERGFANQALHADFIEIA